MASTGDRFGYLPQLDGLRAIAIGLVVAYHLEVANAGGGFLGVDVFLVLSGYLITSILLRERASTGRVRLGRFWVRRMLRLFPAVAVLVLAVSALFPWLTRPGDAPPWVAASIALTYSANLFAAATDWQLGPLGHMWSLALEEQFYLVWPLVLLAITRVRRRPLVVAGALVAGAAAGYFVGWAAFEPRPRMPPSVYFRPDVRAGTLLLGCALGFAMTDPRVRRVLRRHAVALVAGGATVLGTFLVTVPMEWHSSRVVFALVFPLTGVASLMLVAGLAAGESPASRCFSISPIVWLGRLSYSLYLWHVPAFLLTGGLVGSPLGQVTRVLLAVGLAAGSYYLVERPFLRVKDRVEPSVGALETPQHEPDQAVVLSGERLHLGEGLSVRR